MFLLVPAHPGSHGQRAVKQIVVVVVVFAKLHAFFVHSLNSEETEERNVTALLSVPLCNLYCFARRNHLICVFTAQHILTK